MENVSESFTVNKNDTYNTWLMYPDLANVTLEIKILSRFTKPSFSLSVLLHHSIYKGSVPGNENDKDFKSLKTRFILKMNIWDFNLT